MKKSIKIEIPKDILRIKDIFKSNGHDLFIVGGAVRDALLGNTPKDLDIATDATPDKILSMLKGEFETKEVGKAFGVIIVMIDGEEFELATFRTDIGSDGRRPDEVVFTTIEEDVKRRDLTINALFYNIDTEEVVDLVGGIEDMKNGIIRTVGKADDRFKEDELRKLRAIRFCHRLGFVLDDEITDSIQNNNSLARISNERIRDEFLKCMSSAKKVEKLFHTLSGLGMFEWIFPGMDVQVFEDSESVDVTIAHSLRNNNPETVGKLLNKITYTNDEVSRITFLIKFLNLEVGNAYSLKKKFDNSKLMRSELIDFAILNNMSENLVVTFINFRSSVTGHLLMDQGFMGSEIGAEMERRETKNFLYQLHNI